MYGKFTEHSATGRSLLFIVETMLAGIGERFDVHYYMPPHDIARRLLNEISEFESEREQAHRILEKAKERREANADKSGG